MSQTSSPWSDKNRVSSLRENLSKPFEYSPIISNDRRADKDGKGGGYKPHSSAATWSPSTNVKPDQQFRKWRRFYENDLNNLYNLTLTELKEIIPLRKDSLEKRITKEEFYFFIYKNTSSACRKI